MTRSRNSRRGKRYKWAGISDAVKPLESQRSRSRGKAATTRDPEAVPLRDAPWMRWDRWSWD